MTAVTDKSKGLKVAVGVPCAEVGRYSIFWESLLHVRGVTNDNVICGRSANVAENRNGIAKLAIQAGYDAIWYVDDDQVLSPDTLTRLINRDKDIVSGLYLKREVPWIPHMYTETPSRLSRVGGWSPRLLQHGDDGLVEVETTGAGCLLVKTHVLKAMEGPLWRLGQYDKVNWSDDHDFLSRARAKGFKVYVDLDCPVGHQINATIWPLRQPDGTWTSALVQGHEAIAIWPAAEEKPVEQNGEQDSQGMVDSIKEGGAR